MFCCVMTNKQQRTLATKENRIEQQLDRFRESLDRFSECRLFMVPLKNKPVDQQWELLNVGWVGAVRLVERVACGVCACV